jgi:hypothetical protein
MEKIQKFLNKFLLAEVDKQIKYRYPNIEAYNTAVDKIKDFTSDEMKHAFGAKLRSLLPEDEYEQYQNYPNPIPRHIFIIDEYTSVKGNLLYACYVSKSSPKPKKKKYYTLLLIEEVDGKLCIIASFAFGQNNSGEYVWTLVSESSRDEFFSFNKEDNNYELIPNSFGKKINTLRLMPPESCKQSMIEYEKD